MHRGVVGDQQAAVRAPKCAPSPASRSDGDQFGPLGARGRAAGFHMATLRFALLRCAHLGITTQVDCNMIGCRKSIPRLSEKVRMHHLHIAQSVLTGRCRPAAARLLRPPLVSALTVHASAAAGPCMTSCASMSPAGGVAVPLRAAEPKWAWFSLREQARGNVHTAPCWFCISWDGWSGVLGGGYA